MRAQCRSLPRHQCVCSDGSNQTSHLPPEQERRTVPSRRVRSRAIRWLCDWKFLILAMMVPPFIY